MNLLKLMLATVLVLDAALMMTTTAVATSTPEQAIGFSSSDTAVSGLFTKVTTPSE